MTNDLNDAMEEHLCWLDQKYHSIADKSSTVVQDEVKTQLTETKRVLGVSRDSDESEEKILLDKIQFLQKSLEQMATRVLLPISDHSRTTSIGELSQAKDDITNKVDSDIGQGSTGLVGDFSDTMNQALLKLSEMIGTPESGSTVTADISTAFSELQTLIAEVVSDATRVQDTRRDDSFLWVEFFLSNCIGVDNSQPPPFLKIVPKITEVLDLVGATKTKAEAAGYNIGSDYSNLFNQANAMKDSASAAERETAFRYAALAYQEIGAGQYTRQKCFNNLQDNVK